MTHSHDTPTPAMSPETVPSPAIAWIKEADVKRLEQSRKPLQLWVFTRDPSDISGSPYVALSASHLAKEGGEAGAVERLKDAIEGECEGLAITDEQAAAILAHVSLPQPSPALAKGGDAVERFDYLSDAQARELWGTEDDEALPDGRVRVCEGEWVRIPGGYYFDGSAGLLHPETASEACDGCAVTIAPTEGPASQTEPDVEPGQGSWAKRRAQMEASQTEGMGGDALRVRPLPPVGEEAEQYRASRGPEWCKIFDTLRDYRMSNMAWEDGEPGFPLVDVMSRVGDTVTIADGEWEMVALADEISAALTPPETAEAVPPLYLIRKGGAFYRPNSQGYTRSIAEAGRYSLAEAEAITHPNGPNGPRDGMDYIPAPALASDPAPATDDRERLVEENKRLRDALAWYVDPETIVPSEASR